MKNHLKPLIAVICLLFVNASSYSAKLQSLLSENPVYEQLLSNSLKKIAATKDITQQYENINQLKRLSSLYPGQWRTDYYIAYLDIKLFIMGNHKDNVVSLDEAAQEIAVLQNNKDALPSEVYTLEGYLYFARIVLDPAKNGQTYYKEVLSNYQKAIQLNDKNPRPKFLLSLFKQNMSKFMGATDTAFCQELAEIEQSFQDFKPLNPNYPNWGYNELTALKAAHCK